MQQRSQDQPKTERLPPAPQQPVTGPKLDFHVRNLEVELEKKRSMIREGDRRHNVMLEKLKSMEDRIEMMD